MAETGRAIADGNPEAGQSPGSLGMKVLRRIGVFVRCLVLGAVALWASLAIIYSDIPWGWLRVTFSVAFAAFAIWALWINKSPGARLGFAAATIIILAAFFLRQPSNDREWRADVAVAPRATIQGDNVTLHGYRNFDFVSADQFIPHYEEREVSLQDLQSVDFFISYWVEGPIGHTFVSFNFKDAPPVCISIETRPEIDEPYDPIGSIFRKYELIYVVGDELDLVRWRTNYRDEDVYLYPIDVTPEAARQLFGIYLDRINQLADEAEWYNLLKSNCTLNIVRYANKAGRDGRFDIRHLINGWIDRYLYHAGFLKGRLPFDRLRKQSQITEAAIAADDDPSFWSRIRENVPGHGG